MNWKRRLVKVLGSFVTGYGAGLGLDIPLIAILDPTALTVTNVMMYPVIAGLIVALPQLGKVLNEYGSFRPNS